MVLKFLNKISGTRFDKFGMEEELQTLKSSFEKICKNPYERIPFEYFDCNSWIESKLKKESLKKKSLEYYSNNKEHIRKQQANYKKENKDLIKVHNRNKLQRRRNELKDNYIRKLLKKQGFKNKDILENIELIETKK